MRKRLLGFVFMVCVLAPAAFAGEGAFTCGSVTVAVPNGWTAQCETTFRNQIILFADEEFCMVSILADSTYGLGTWAFSKALAAIVGGEIHKVDGRDNYFYILPENKEDMAARAYIKGRVTLVFYLKGAWEHYDATIGHIWSSLKSSNPKEQALFDELE